MDLHARPSGASTDLTVLVACFLVQGCTVYSAMRLAHLPCFINSFVVVGVCLSLHVSRPSLYHLSFLAISYAILSYAIPALSYAPPFSLTPSLPSQIRPSRLSLAPFSYAHPSSLTPSLPSRTPLPSLSRHSLTPRPSSLTPSLHSLTSLPFLLALLLRLFPALSHAPSSLTPLPSLLCPSPLLSHTFPALESPTPLAFSLTPLSNSSPCSPTPLLL